MSDIDALIHRLGGAVTYRTFDPDTPPARPSWPVLARLATAGATPSSDREPATPQTAAEPRSFRAAVSRSSPDQPEASSASTPEPPLALAAYGRAPSAPSDPSSARLADVFAALAHKGPAGVR